MRPTHIEQNPKRQKMIRIPQLAAAAPRDALKRLLGAALIGAAALAAPAYAGIVDFEGYFGPAAHGDFLTQAGYDVGFYSNVVGAVYGEDLVGSIIDGSDRDACIGGSCPVNNSSMYYAALDDSYVDITSATGARIQIKSFDASFIGGTAPGTSYPAIAGLLRIQGFLADGNSAIETYQLAGPTANSFNFAHYNTSAAFGAMNFVEAIFFGFACNNAGSCSAFSTDRGQFGIDNITLTAVPEPSSALMVALGLVGLGAVTRRRNAKAKA
jgi:hypothetical protein